MVMAKKIVFEITADSDCTTIKTWINLPIYFLFILPISLLHCWRWWNILCTGYVNTGSNLYLVFLLRFQPAFSIPVVSTWTLLPPVSYTHLDVYKRQSLMNTSRVETAITYPYKFPLIHVYQLILDPTQKSIAHWLLFSTSKWVARHQAAVKAIT